MTNSQLQLCEPGHDHECEVMTAVYQRIKYKQSIDNLLEKMEDEICLNLKGKK